MENIKSDIVMQTISVLTRVSLMLFSSQKPLKRGEKITTPVIIERTLTKDIKTSA